MGDINALIAELRAEIEQLRLESIKLTPHAELVFKNNGFKVVSRISDTGYGEIYKAEKINTGKFAVIKLMYKMYIPWRVQRKYLENEFLALTTVKYKNVLEVYRLIRTDDCYYIIMEYAANGQLSKECYKGPIEESNAWFWFKQCTEAVNFMHVQHKMCHRNINQENIFLDEKENCKLTAFRYAKPMTTGGYTLTSDIVGKPQFYSPEMTMEVESYNPFAADVWAMGVMLYYMLNNTYPFKYPTKGKKDNEGMKAFVDHQLRGCVHRKDLRKPPSPLVQDFIKKCLDPNPKTRITTQQMLEHPWLRDEPN